MADLELPASTGARQHHPPSSTPWIAEAPTYVPGRASVNNNKRTIAEVLQIYPQPAFKPTCKSFVTSYNEFTKVRWPDGGRRHWEC